MPKALLAMKSLVNQYFRPVMKELLITILYLKWSFIVLGFLISDSSAQAADPIELRAGPMTMIFEPDNAFLRYLRVGREDVLIGINAPIRNELWGTVKPQVSNLELDQGDSQFTLTFDALCKDRDIDFLWKGKLTGTSEGKIEFNFDGTARSTFKRNRIGFCVLHSSSAGGKAWVITNIDSSESKGAFPEFISPHQPAREIRKIAHEMAPGLWAHVQMEGDIFEMEDQRNWTDASFKTYCTPLEMPYPVTVKKGDTVTQKVTIWLEGEVEEYAIPAKGASDAVTLKLTEHAQPLPRIGIQVSSEIDGLSNTEIDRLKNLRLDHLRVDLKPPEELEGSLISAINQAKQLGVKLHVAVWLESEIEKELNKIRRIAKQHNAPIAAWFIMQANENQLQLAREILWDVSTGTLYGAPRDGISFTELNRERPSQLMMEIVAYNATPQIHASDNSSIVETLPIQGDTVRSAKQFIGTAPLVVSPITFHTALPGKDPLPGELPWYVDARQTSLFAAGWTLGSIKFLAEASVYGATFYETIGWRGIMDSANPPNRPAKFDAKAGTVFPIYHVLRDFSDFAGGRIQGLESTDNLSVVGLTLRKGNKVRMLIVNLKDRDQKVEIRGLNQPQITVSILDGDNVEKANKDPEAFNRRVGKAHASRQPIDLGPHAIARVDYLR